MIGEALADDTGQRNVCAVGVANPKSNTVAVTKVELREVSMQVLFLAVPAHAAHAALEDTEIAFNGVGVDDASPVLFAAMIDEGVHVNCVQFAIRPLSSVITLASASRFLRGIGRTLSSSAFFA